ncbi:hypothetical protein ACFVYA_41535 [Amycolatopsis sp. NPDC058278]
MTSWSSTQHTVGEGLPSAMTGTRTPPVPNSGWPAMFPVRGERGSVPA